MTGGPAAAAAAAAGVQCPDPGNTAWMIVATILVLGMMPGLAFFEAGLLRRKSVLSVMTQVFLGLSVMSVLWFLFGFSVVYSGDYAGIIGDVQHALFFGLDNNCQFDKAMGVPSLVYALFQMMFASITPLLITGAIAERMRLLGFVVFIMVWEVLVYYPVAHSIWGGGLLAQLGVQDFAGGITIHTTAGTAAVIASYLLGHRPGFDKYDGEFPPHNIPLAAIGVAFLCTGWGGFNAGSALGSGFVAAVAMSNTAICATTTCVTWAVVSAIKHRKRIDPIMMLNAYVVGLAGVTPASGFIDVWACLPLGIILGVASYFSIVLLKHKLRIDDALDVGAVHGVPGVVGSLAIGFFATSRVNSASADGVFYGGGRLLWVQLVGVLIAITWTTLITTPLILLLRRGHWFSLQPQHLTLGLDGKDHQAAAYHSEGSDDDNDSARPDSSSRRKLDKSDATVSGFRLDLRVNE